METEFDGLPVDDNYDGLTEDCAIPVQQPDDVSEESASVQQLVPTGVDVKKFAAMFILKARDVHLIPQDTIDALLPDVTSKLFRSHLYY